MSTEHAGQHETSLADTGFESVVDEQADENQNHGDDRYRRRRGIGIDDVRDPVDHRFAEPVTAVDGRDIEDVPLEHPSEEQAQDHDDYEVILASDEDDESANASVNEGAHRQEELFVIDCDGAADVPRPARVTDVDVAIAEDQVDADGLD